MGSHAARAALLLGWLLVPALCQQSAPKMETVFLEDGTGAAKWNVAEATATASDQHGLAGKPSLRFHVDVNHETGEKAYPIGWPRINRPVPEGQRDWSGFDFLELVIYSETSRDALPKAPLGFILHTPDRAQEYHRVLSEVRKGETARIVIPLSEIPRHEDVTLMQFYLSESNYRHLDTVDFLIAEVALTRYAEPTVSDAQTVQAIAYDDVTHLGARFRLLGLPAGQKTPVRCRVRQGEKVLGDMLAQLDRGEHELWAKLTSRPTPGEGVVEVLLGKPVTAGKVRFVASPFPGKGGK
jgi:hypothetical protein